MENIILKNADLFCPTPLGRSDVLISKGVVAKIGQDLEFDKENTFVLDCTDKIVCPMFVDGNALIVSKLIYTEKDFFAGGIGAVVGTMRFGSDVNNIEAYLDAAKKLTERGVDCHILTDGIHYLTNTLTGDISADMASISRIIGAKTALNSKGFSRFGNPNFSMIQELAVRCYGVSMITKRPTQLLVHLERQLAPHDHNLEWIDQIVENTGVPYNIFKLLHAENYPEDALQYARKGCYVDFTAFEDKYDRRYDNLIDFVNAYPNYLDRISISSNSFDLIEKNGNFSKYSQPKSILNTIKTLVLDKNLAFKDAIKMVTFTPASLIPKEVGVIKEGVDCKALVLDKDFNISAIIDYKQTL